MANVKIHSRRANLSPKKRRLALVVALSAVSLFTHTIQAQSPESTRVCLELKNTIEEGDIVFLSIDSALFRRVARASQGWSSHVGIAFRGRNQQWEVFESTIPLSKRTDLCSFISRSKDAEVVVNRIHGGLRSDEKFILRHETNKYLGKLYHLGFNFQSRRQFCSKLVYQSYQGALNIEVGKLVSFRELFADLANSEEGQEDLKFWKWWYFGKIPMDRITVTPESQLRDPKFRTVYDNR